VIWLKPKLVADVTYRSIGSDGGMRHPSFKGLREDKNAKEVSREVETDVSSIVEKTEPDNLQKKILTAVEKGERKTLLNPSDETQVRKINGHELKFTNLSKVYWPDEGYTKRDMLNYYYQVAPYMLPYMKDRPQTLNRFPNGIYGESFYPAREITAKNILWFAPMRPAFCTSPHWDASR
jgi:bifunctional non-homologous end joining protein LigD